MSLMKFSVATIITVIAIALVATASIQGFTSSNGTGGTGLDTLLVEFHSTFSTNSTGNMEKGERKYGEGELFMPGEGPDGTPIGTWKFTEVATEPVGTPGAIHLGVFRIFGEGEIFVSSLTEIVDGFFTHNGAITGGTGKFAGAGGTFTNLTNPVQLIEFNFVQHVTNGETFYACVNERSGEMKMVGEGLGNGSQNDDNGDDDDGDKKKDRDRVSDPLQCKKNWRLISWNSEGPQGPQGPRGPQGPEGPPGPLPPSYCDLQHQLAKLVLGFKITEDCAEPGPPHEEIDVQLVRKDVFLFGEHPIGFLDSDADGLTDKQEDLIGTDSGWWDTDGDGIGDGEEFHGNANPFEPGGDTAPFVDTDDDGLTDFQESFLVTDPGQPDSDGDGFFDSEEFWENSDPRDGASHPQPRPEVPAGTIADLLIEAEVRVDDVVLPQEAAGFPLPIWLSDEIVGPPDCTIGFRIPEAWPENMIEARFSAVYFDHDEEVFPVGGVVGQPPDADGLRVELLFVDVFAGDVFGVQENWFVQCDNPSGHHFTMFGSAWIADGSVADRDGTNNNLSVQMPIAVIAEVNAKAAGMEVLLNGEPFGFPDSDADDLNDSTEELLGTDLFNPDSDGDGVPDGHEFWDNANPLTTGFDPIPSDNSDEDSLTDWQEGLIGTDPGNPDSDGDGPWDDHEFFQGGDPLNEQVLPAKDQEVPFGELAFLEAFQHIAVDADTFSVGLGSVDVRVMDQLMVEPEGTTVFFVTPGFLSVAADVVYYAWNWNTFDQFEIGPDPDGVVTAPPGYGIQIHFTVEVEPGTAVPVVTRWGVEAGEPGHHHVSLSKSVWPADEHVFEMDPANNRFRLGGPLVFNDSPSVPEGVFIDDPEGFLAALSGVGVLELIDFETIGGLPTGDGDPVIGDEWVVDHGVSFQSLPGNDLKICGPRDFHSSHSLSPGACPNEGGDQNEDTLFILLGPPALGIGLFLVDNGGGNGGERVEFVNIADEVIAAIDFIPGFFVGGVFGEPIIEVRVVETAEDGDDVSYDEVMLAR